MHADSYEWLEGFEGRAQNGPVAWFYELNMAMLTRPTGTLALYGDRTSRLLLGRGRRKRYASG